MDLYAKICLSFAVVAMIGAMAGLLLVIWRG